jgi:hypothetical protein
MHHRRDRTPHVPDHLRTIERPRHEARLPVEQRLAQPFAYDPQSGMVIAPWQSGELQPEDEPRLCSVLDQIAAFNGALHEPCWIWPEGDRAPVPIATDNLHAWLRHWSADRATYRDRRWLGSRVYRSARGGILIPG